MDRQGAATVQLIYTRCSRIIFTRRRTGSLHSPGTTRVDPECWAAGPWEAPRVAGLMSDPIISTAPDVHARSGFRNTESRTTMLFYTPRRNIVWAIVELESIAVYQVLYLHPGSVPTLYMTPYRPRNPLHLPTFYVTHALPKTGTKISKYEGT